MSVVRGFGQSEEPLTAEEEARFRALAEREPNFGPAARSWIPGLLATLDAVRLSAQPAPNAELRAALRLVDEAIFDLPIGDDVTYSRGYSAGIAAARASLREALHAALRDSS